MKTILLLLLLSSNAFAGFAPTFSQGSGDSSNIYTNVFKFPGLTVTHVGGTATFSGSSSNIAPTVKIYTNAGVTTTGTVSTSSVCITSVGSTNGIYPGEGILDTTANANLTKGTYVVAIPGTCSSGQIQMSAVAATSGSSQSLTFGPMTSISSATLSSSTACITNTAAPYGIVVGSPIYDLTHPSAINSGTTVAAIPGTCGAGFVQMSQNAAITETATENIYFGQVYTPPSSILYSDVTIVGGGGGGGTNNADPSGGGGAGACVYNGKLFNQLYSGVSYSLFVGGGGAIATAGLQSTFGTNSGSFIPVIMGGGSAGAAGNASTLGSGGVATPISSSSFATLNGFQGLVVNGGGGAGVANSVAIPGVGGNSCLGGGGPTSFGGANGAGSPNTGGGGAGGTSSNASQPGASGVIVIVPHYQ